MRMRYKVLTALGVAMLAVSGAVAETTPPPAPAQAYPYGYMNPFDPNWWLLTFNNMLRLYTVPVAGMTAPAGTTPYPAGYVNPIDPNWWLANAPTSAGTTSKAAPAMGSAYMATETPYGTIYTINYADPQAWTKLLSQPYAAPGQGTPKP